MLIKPGVSIKNLKRECRRALSQLEAAYPDFVITSADEGTHGASSLHYADLAIDIRRKYPASWRQIDADRVRRILGPNFDVIDEGTHLHIEYDP